MEERATRVAAALLAAAGRGARVALVLEEYDQFFTCMLGVWLAGQVVVPLNTSLPQSDVDWLVGKSRPDVIVLPADETCPTPDDGPVRLVVAAARTGAWTACGRPAAKPLRPSHRTSSRPCARTSSR